VKIAIVGAGVSGLTAAYVLSDHHEVTLFEREETLGGHAHTVDAPGGDADYPVDTGFLVYNEVTCPARASGRSLTREFHEFQLPRRTKWT